MKLNKYLMLSLVMTAMGALCACGEDEEEDVTPVVDVRDQAVGEYEGTVACFVECDSKLIDISSVIEDQSELEFAANVTKNGDNAITINVDGDNIVVSKIAAASNGFVGDIENEYKLNGYKAVGYKACTLTSEGSTVERYSAVYLSGEKLLSFAISTDAEAILTMIAEEDKAAVLAKITGLTEEELTENWDNLLIIECFKGVKK